MLRHFGFERGLQHLFCETAKKAAWADQIHPLGACPVNELACEALIKNWPSGKFIHDLSLPARWHPPSLSRPLHRYRDTPSLGRRVTARCCRVLVADRSSAGDLANPAERWIQRYRRGSGQVLDQCLCDPSLVPLGVPGPVDDEESVDLG
jgi:hypothetical protein